MSLHQDNCIAPICAADTNSDFKKQVLWYPGEAVCMMKAEKFQKVQRKINKIVSMGTFKHPDRYFTASALESVGRVTSSTKGK